MIPSPMWALGTHQLTVPSLLSLPDFMEFHSTEACSSIQQRLKGSLHISIALFLLAPSYLELVQWFLVVAGSRNSDSSFLISERITILCFEISLPAFFASSSALCLLAKTQGWLEGSSHLFSFSYTTCCPIPENSCFRHFVQFASYLRLEDKLDSLSWLEGKDLCIF